MSEHNSGESILYDREQLPASSTTFTLADGNTITCAGQQEQTRLEIKGPHTTNVAPDLAWKGCAPTEAPVSFTNECGTTELGGNEMGTEREWKDEPRTWNGTLTVLEGKGTSNPTVGYVYKTSPAGSQFFEQVDCEGGWATSFVIGGEQENEAIVTAIEPVNTMSESHTLSIGPLAHKVKGTKPLEALVNGKWEPISIKTTMLFPTTEPSWPETQPRALRVRTEEELKATP